MACKYQPSFAKNMIRRSLWGVIDRHPKSAEIKQLWAHFGSRCAYCGTAVSIKGKDAHLDHLIPGDGNHISNRVLSCANCNEKQKRERDWFQFLQSKCPVAEEFQRRQAKINEWMARFPPLSTPNLALISEAENEIERAISAFDSALARLRELKRGANLSQPSTAESAAIVSG